MKEKIRKFYKKVKKRLKKPTQIAIQVVTDDNKSFCIQFDRKAFIDLYYDAKKEGNKGINIQIKDESKGKTYEHHMTLDFARNLIRQSFILSKDIIPKSISEYISDFTQLIVENETLKIVGRDKEIERVWLYLSQKDRNNVFIIGDPEVGKTVLGVEIARQIACNECPKEFRKHRVLMLDVDSLLKELDVEKDEKVSWSFNRKFEKLQKYIIENKDKIILYIDKAILLKTNVTLTKVFHMLVKNDVPILTTSSVEDFEDFFLNDFYIDKYLNFVYLDEPQIKEVQPMIQGKIDKLKEIYKIGISDEVVKFAIYTSELNYTISYNPGNTINVLKRAFIQAKRKGKKKVDKQTVLSCYDIDYKMYNKMKDTTKKATAYHEAGHYLVNVMTDASKDMTIGFVSILPMNGFLGVNWVYYDDSQDAVPSKEYYLNTIAMRLAGRVAEKKITNKATSGAYSDLESANVIAREASMKCGLSEESDNKNRHYDYEDYYLLSESKKSQLDAERQKFIDEGYSIAEKIIDENEELLGIIAGRLIKDEILTGEQLEEICKKYWKIKNGDGKVSSRSKAKKPKTSKSPKETNETSTKSSKETKNSKATKTEVAETKE